jgi:short-subunit dehydrogenase
MIRSRGGRIENKVVIIKVLAKVFASVGWNVVISARTPSKLEQVLKELEGLKENVIAVPSF